MMKTPEYYNTYGLSPIEAMKNGLTSHEQYIGFLKGNIIKYTVRAGLKHNPIEDMEKAIHYATILKQEYETNNQDKDGVYHSVTSIPTNEAKQ